MPRFIQPSEPCPLPQLPHLSFEAVPLAGNDSEDKIFSKTPSCVVSSGDDKTTDDCESTSTGSIPLRDTRRIAVKSWYTRWVLEWWMVEILSWFFGLVCMVIITVVLLRYNGKPDPKWRIGLSIGSFISIFSGFAKSALLLPTAEALGQLKWSWFRHNERAIIDFERLDSASRGPMGSLVLLVRTRKVTLATIGAAVVLLSLPLDGFFQRILSYPVMRVLDPSNATISRAIGYHTLSQSYLMSGSLKTPPDLELDSVTSPFWNTEGSLPGVSMNCPTGDCTFDPFYSLALDFQCQTLPSILEFGCHNASAEWKTTTDYYMIWFRAEAMPFVESCGYYLDVPNYGKQLMSGYEVQSNGSIGEVLSARFFPIMDLATNQQYWNGSFALRDVPRLPVADFIVVSTPMGFDGAQKNMTPVATECAVYWVVNELAANVSNGLLSEHVLSTHHFESNATDPWDIDDPSTYVANFSMTLSDPHSVTGPTSTFGLDNTTAFKVWEVWTEIAPSTYNLLPDGETVQKYFWPVTPPRLIVVDNPNFVWEPPNNITEHMRKTVQAQNQILRRKSYRSPDPKSGGGGLVANVAVGRAYRSTQLLKVRWGWIAMPLSLLLISGFFLAATVIVSSKNQVGIYKTSALASLFGGLGERKDEDGELRFQLLIM
ncbi:hypothetical protein FKW77_000488 [Venturia effusa]|uniref:Uncharacterized protein n=1 Tax=Venturia effusa TaxID=50376 RepID=A0A517LA95_9PEZI|nr:hypothetical protein FKW77_000488 [Venturia effusa]